MSEEAETDMPKNYFAMQKFMLTFLGFSLSPSLPLIYKAYTYILLILMVIYLIITLPDFIRHGDNFDEFINNMLFDTGFIAIMVKVVTIFLNRAKMNKLFTTLESGVFQPNFERGANTEKKLISDCVRLTWRQVIVSTFVGTLTIISCIFTALLIKHTTGKNTLPFGTISMTSDSNYVLVFVLQSIAFGFGIPAYMLVDAIYSSVLAHICVQCQILQNFIKSSITYSLKNMNKEKTLEMSATVRKESIEIPWKYLQPTIKEIVVYHMAIIQVAEDIEDIFNITTLAVFLGISVCSCFIMYQASLYSVLDPNFVRTFIIFTTAMLPLCITSYWGSEVIFESLAISDACYEVDFVGINLKYQKALVLIIQRSQRSIKMTVGKFAMLSLVTMLGVFRASYSYFMLLRRVNEK